MAVILGATTHVYPPFNDSAANLVKQENDTTNNGTADGTPTAEDLFYYYLVTYLAPVVFAVITAVGTVGNSLVIYVIWSRKTLQTGTNLLLLNLAVADILFLLICSTSKAYQYASPNFSLGDTCCKFVMYFLYVSGYVTVYTLVAVSGLRFLTIVCADSTAKYRTKTNVFTFICFIWIVMLLLNVPTYLAHQLNSVKAPGYKPYIYCGIDKESEGAVFVTFFAFAYALPLTVISFLYLLVLCHLHHAKASSLAQTPAQSRRTRRVCRVIVLVVVIFGLSWLPLHVTSLIGHFGTQPKPAWYLVFKILWNAMAYGNSCANPFIYNFFSQDFRRAFQEVIGCGKQIHRKYRSTDREAETMTLTAV